jgi:hypothetical protein
MGRALERSRLQTVAAFSSPTTTLPPAGRAYSRSDETEWREAVDEKESLEHQWERQ